ncbi:WD40 repeat-containing protein [Mycoavidus cysteinexigens]|uniref:WD40 repeat-containing protein n=1 Tax=Mycoavidus cysteinexigens TaxID=1553431 RepID=A0A2Z6EU74_9BURK|nr:NACHT domain-containing protein [Mycoavidus cysteinexigens]BBE08980.1 WD40 repeat-containing protein [Mycoavidus cysteinexigens]GAM52292.1 hypothetical protein EBME_0755 [bacterium endosymbiont of Mortierella elongata FMR23-6]GLR01175.1 hypothetical protein GCM10007934_09870 [Mycoavidus cysteinexigens]
MFTPVSGLFSRSNPAAQSQHALQTPQQMLEQVRLDKDTADWYKREGQVVEAENHYKAAQKLLEEVLEKIFIDLQTVKMFGSIYSEYSALLRTLGRTAEAKILEQKERSLFERYTASSTSSRKREVERGSSGVHLNKKNYTAPTERPAQVPLPIDFTRELERLSLHPMPLSSTASFFSQDLVPTLLSQPYILMSKLEEIKETRHLAWCLQEGPRHNLEMYELRDGANEVIRRFANSHFCNLAIVQEVVALSPLDHVGHHRTIINRLESELENFINVAALQGLAFMILNRSHLSQDEHLAADCVRLFGQLGRLLNLAHRKNNKLQLTSLLQALTLLLDTMYEAQIGKLGDESLKTSMNSLLKQLQDEKEKNSHQDVCLAFQARYARQALKRLENQQEWKEVAIQAALQFGGSAAYFAGAIQTLDPDKFWEGFERFQKGIRLILEKYGFHRSGTDWYIALCYIDLLIEKGWLRGIDQFLSQGNYAKDQYFLQGLCDRLERIACRNHDKETKDSALRFLMSLKQGGERWGRHEAVKQYAAQTLDRIGNLWTPLTLEAMDRLDYAPPAWHPFWQDKPSSLILKEVQETIQHGAYARTFLPQIKDFRQEMNQSYANLVQTVETGFMEHSSVAQTMGRGLVQVQAHVQELVTGVSELEKGLGKLNAHAETARYKPLAQLGKHIEELRAGYLNTLEELDAVRDALTFYIPAQGQETAYAQTSFILIDKVYDFLSSDKKVLLLLGEAGAGKTTFNRHLTRTLWDKYQQFPDAPIPLFIALAEHKPSREDLIESYLLEQGFSENAIEVLRKENRCIFILDGFDEIKDHAQAFYTDNKLDHWKNAQIIISSRPEYLADGYHSQFQKRGQTSALQEYWISPISDDWIKAYIEKYIEHTERIGWTLKRYQVALNRLPTLKEAIRRPFLLRMALDLLPDLIESESAPVTRITLYDEYISRWWSRSKERLQYIDLTEEEEKARSRLGPHLTAEGLRASQEMAVTLTQKGIIQASYDPEYDEVVPEAWRAYFEKDAEKRLLLFNAPLIHQGQHYRFIHKSIQDYLVARAICGPRFSSSAPDAHAVLNQYLLVDEPLILDFLVERVEQYLPFKAYLYAWIEASKDPLFSVAVGAANAITILVRAGVQFNRADLKGIRIPGADLSKGVFDSVQLQEADLTGVKLQAAWLRQANFSGAQMAGAQFGEWPYLQEKSIVCSCAYSPDGKTHAVGLENNTISLYQTSNWEKILTLCGHTSRVTSIVYSPQGDQLASGSWDHMVRLWNAQTGALLHTLSGHTSLVNSAVYAPHGNRLASGSHDKTVRLWDAKTGVCLRILSSHTGKVTSVAYSPQGDQLVSGSDDKTACLWEIQTGRLLYTLSGHRHSVTNIAYSPKGNQIASSSKDKTVRLWDVKTGALCRTLSGHTGWVMSAVYSPQGDQLASGSWDKTVRLWDVKTGALRHILNGHIGFVSSISYSPNGDQLASGGYDKTVRLWDVKTEVLRHSLSEQMEDVRSIVYSPRGDQIASSSSDGKTVRLWDAQTGKLRHTLSGHKKSISSIVYAPQGNQLASASNDKTVCLWDAQTGALCYTLSGHTDWVHRVMYSPQGDQLASASSDKTVRLWDAQTGKLQHTLNGHTKSIRSIVYSPQGDQLASGSWDQAVCLWDPQTGTLRHTLSGHTKDIDRVVYSPKGDQLASSSDDKTVRLWDAQTGRLCHTLSGHKKSIRSIVYSPQGDQLASASDDKTVRLWDAQTGTLHYTLSEHTNWVLNIVYSPQGDQLASGSFDNTLRLWDVKTGQCQKVIQGFGRSVTSIAWKEIFNGNYLVTGSGDKSVRQWEVRKEGGEYKVFLCWSSTHESLTLADTLIENVQCLSNPNKALLKQHGAVGEPSSSLHGSQEIVVDSRFRQDDQLRAFG